MAPRQLALSTRPSDATYGNLKHWTLHGHFGIAPNGLGTLRRAANEPPSGTEVFLLRVAPDIRLTDDAYQVPCWQPPPSDPVLPVGVQVRVTTPPALVMLNVWPLVEVVVTV